MEVKFEIKDYTIPKESIIFSRIKLSNEELREAYKEFMGLAMHVFSNNGAVLGPCYLRYVDADKDSTTVDVCLVVENKLPTTEKIFFEEYDEHIVRVAIGYCKGEYGDLPSAYTQMADWFGQQNETRANLPMIERFLNFKPGMPKNELLTELIWPLA